MSSYQPSHIGRKKFRRVTAGEAPSAAEYNALLSVVERLQELHLSNQPGFWIKPIRMSEPMGEFGTGDSSDAHNKSGNVQQYDALTNDWFDPPPSEAERKTEIANAMHHGLVYDNSELLWCVYDKQSGKYCPLNPERIRHAITCKDDDGSYPPENNCPNTYPIKFLRVQYAKQAGRNVPIYTYLDPGDSAPDNVVFNDYGGDAEDGGGDQIGSYIPEGTVIWCYHSRDSWFTWIYYSVCEGSSSSSSGEQSSGSSNSSSASSASSLSSSSKSSSSVSSVSSSSNSSSNSSSSDSSSSTSSASSLSSLSSSSQSSASSASDFSESSISVSLSSGICQTEFDGPIEDVQGYRSGVVQILGHDEAGCLVWLDWEDCA